MAYFFACWWGLYSLCGIGDETITAQKLLKVEPAQHLDNHNDFFNKLIIESNRSPKKMLLEHNDDIHLISMYLKEFIFLGLFYFKNNLGKSTTISINSKVSKKFINKLNK